VCQWERRCPDASGDDRVGPEKVGPKKGKKGILKTYSRERTEKGEKRGLAPAASIVQQLRPESGQEETEIKDDK